jgi:hypothetical protein
MPDTLSEENAPTTDPVTTLLASLRLEPTQSHHDTINAWLEECGYVDAVEPAEDSTAPTAEVVASSPVDVASNPSAVVEPGTFNPAATDQVV